MPSEAQLAANRLNAQKSTGPRTDAGKAASSRNSLKHTALAQALLVSSQSHMESADDFLELCAEYHSALDPVGPLEEMLIEQIVTAVWRTRRAHQAEAGEIALNLEDVEKKSDEINTVPALLQAAEANHQEDVLSLLDKSTTGCKFILARLGDARAAIRRDGRLTPDTFNRFNIAFRGRAKALTEPLYEMAVTLETNPGKLDPAILLQNHQTELWDYLDRQIQHFEEILASRRANPDAHDRARLDAAMLPNANTLNKILRYETVLQKQIFSAMDQLEKLQSRRRSSASACNANSSADSSGEALAKTEASAENSHESSLAGQSCRSELPAMADSSRHGPAAPSVISVPSCSKSVPEPSTSVPSGLSAIALATADADHRLPPCRADLSAVTSVKAEASANGEAPAQAEASPQNPRESSLADQSCRSELPAKADSSRHGPAAPSVISVPSCSKSVPEPSTSVPSGADHRLSSCESDPQKNPNEPNFSPINSQP